MDCKQYNIVSAYFYFADDKNFNAFAWRKNVICVNNGVIEELFQLFINNQNLDNELLKYDNFNQYLVNKEKLNLQILMFQFLTQYIYYHELGHLIQYSNSHGNQQAICENYQMANKNGDYKIIDTLKEIDADLYSSGEITLHILNFYFNNLEEQYKNKEVVFILIVTSLSSVFTCMMLFFGAETELYYKGKVHPHPIIRITYFILVTIESLRKNLNYNFTKEEIFEEVLFLSHKIMGGNFVIKYLKDVNDNITDIISYILEMSEEAEKYPFLCSNSIIRD